jgi:hypothetical protein
MTDSNLDYRSLSTQQQDTPQPTLVGSACLLTSIIVAFFSISPNALPSEIARQVAIPVGAGLAISLVWDSTSGLKNLFRTDIVCLLAFYILTLVEFLSPEEKLNTLLTSEQTIPALKVILASFAGLVIGRHFSPLKPIPRKWLNFSSIPDQSLFRLFLISAFVGYFYVLLSVNFNISEAMKEMLGPRFSQSWARGQYGGWSSLLSELSLLRFAIPPIAGILWNRRQTLKSWQMGVVILVLAFVFYQGFTGGTRTVFISYLAGFITGYLLTLEKITFWKLTLPPGVMGYIVFAASEHMLKFRSMGLRNYIKFEAYQDVFQSQEGVSIDFNIRSIAAIVDAMPSQYDFLGWELIYVFASKPIPRALWSNKPEELSTSIEDLLGAQAWTVSATYAGEAYMSGGMMIVILISLLIGTVANWWTRIMAQQSSGYAVAVGALGFFVAALTMRSLAFVTTNLLPIFALIFLAKVVPSWIGAPQRQ